MDSERERRLAREAAESLYKGLKTDGEEAIDYFLEFTEKFADLIAFRIDIKSHSQDRLEMAVKLIREKGRIRADHAVDLLIEKGVFTSEYRARHALRVLVKSHRLRLVDGIYLQVGEAAELPDGQEVLSKYE